MSREVTQIAFHDLEGFFAVGDKELRPLHHDGSLFPRGFV